MKRFFAVTAAFLAAFVCAAAFGADGTFKLGIIGATTSHVPAFVKTINNPDGADIFKKFEVTAVYPGGTPDNADSWDRVEGYTQQCVDAGLKVYSTIEEMLPEVDGVLLESVDGRLHLEQVKPVIAAKKPVYIDKPMGGSLKDVLEIFELAEAANVPVFSASSLRYVKAYQEMRNNSPIGEIYGADATSPCSINGKHPSLYWYGIHGVESLFTVMGPDCVSVSRTNTPNADVVVGVWKNKTIGTFRGIRKGAAPYSCKVFGENGVANVGDYEGYEPLLVEICKFFETGVSPVDKQETINIFAFMTAADMSRKEKGKSVKLEDAIQAAQDEKRVTVTVTTTEKSEFIWNDGENEPKTFESYEELRPAVEELLEEYDVVRFIFDNRAGIPFDTVQKAFIELEDARLANYIY
ncbi:MAG: Gfo/Idh/MocA family oxidoreductase [Thermoguttaceae bacterium]|nr:Gfo/Idh/MocA family oxidoreductase [Thermoguttaceae bacterium]